MVGYAREGKRRERAVVVESGDERREIAFGVSVTAGDDGRDRRAAESGSEVTEGDLAW